MSALSDLRELPQDGALSADQIFDAIVAAGAALSEGDREDGDALEIAIRLLEARRNGQVPEGCRDAVEMLVEECGLYPYVDREKLSLLSQVVVESHGIQLDEKMYLHAKQMAILLHLLAGENVILSAPTSFGKSALIDALLAYRQPSTVVMILPTIALIDETRRRLSQRFGDIYDVITTVTDERQSAKKTIFVLTQERFLKRTDIPRIDLFFVDEFYKLDPTRADTRYETLNLALYQGLKKARQSFLAGPHISGITLGEHWRGSFKFIQTDYRTVTVNVFDRSQRAEKFESFIEDLRSVGRDSSIVFTATPGSATNLMAAITKAGVSYQSDLSASIGDWIAENYHVGWPIAQSVRSGIAIHHGRLPRSLGQLFVQLFDSGGIKVLICTSTLIEGVNTSAANVFIYDKKINRSDFDFFSFANIRGRVGRFMRHFVGRAFLYHEPPAETATVVDVPILSDPGGSTDFIMMNVDAAALSDEGKDRRRDLPRESGLSELILRDYGNIGVELLQTVLVRIREILAADESLLSWRQLPEKEQRIALAELCLMIAHARNEQTGLHTAKQVAWAWGMLAKVRTLPAFLRWFSRTFFTDDIPTGIDEAFRFLQACEFGFPRSFMAIEALVRHARPDLDPAFSTYVVMVENWFRPTWMKQLDEAGIPLPLAERLDKLLKSPASRKDALLQLQALNLDGRPDFSKIDRLILEMART